MLVTENTIQIFLRPYLENNKSGGSESMIWVINFFCMSILLNLYMVVRCKQAFAPFMVKHKIGKTLPFIREEFRTKMKQLPVLKM